MKTIIATKISFFIMLLLFFGCEKKKEGTAELTVKMIDAPDDYQEVNVEVLQVKINHENGGWIDLPTQAGVYNLLTLQNDVFATLVDPYALPSGRINQLRLILGDQNTLMVDSVVHPLNTPSAQMSGLKININQRLSANQQYELVLDFEVESSVVEHGNGTYSLKPVLKVDTIHPI